MKVNFPYGKELVEFDFENYNFKGILSSKLHDYKTSKNQFSIVEESILNPIGSLPLCELSKNKNKVVIIASDHTRPVPSKIIIPLMLREIRKGNKNADITILIATGCHRGTRKEELIDKFGIEIYNNEKIVIHDCDNSEFVKIGILPSGGECILNKLIIDADLLVSEGFIEPHFFAGFSGGRKSVLPGVANRRTVLANHCSEFINDDNSRTGILENNLIHKDMVWAARNANLAFIVNVVINEKKEVIYAVSGDMEQAHQAGCKFLNTLCKVDANVSDIVITTNGGYPLDQNIYQAVKGMTAAESTVKQDGVIIMLAKSNDGHGGEGFYRQLADEPDIKKTMDLFMSRKRNETVSDQWQTQIFLRILMKARVIYVSEAEKALIEQMHMIPASSIEEALIIAKKIINKDNCSIIAIPDGVSVMVI
ncbi:MAG: nickel-dependent lactate racemase [Pleomorphochaeta sp.]